MAWNGYLNEQNVIAPLEGYARKYLDENSAYNTGMYNRFKQAGQDAAGQQYQQGLRMQAMGQNPFANQQYRSNMAQANQAAMDQYINNHQASQQLGQGFMNMAVQARGQMDQLEQARKFAAQQKEASMINNWIGVGGTLLGAGLGGGAIGGLLSGLFRRKDRWAYSNEGGSEYTPEFIRKTLTSWGM